MFDDTHYVPILKGRAAEYGALAKTTDADRFALTPLIEVAPIAWDWTEERPRTGIDAHINNAVQRLDSCWGAERRAFIDLLWLDADGRCAGDEHPMAFTLRRGKELGLRLVPALGLECDEAYRRAVRDGHDGHGAVLRLRSRDLAGANSADEIAALLAGLGFRHGDVDLIVDLKELNPKEVDFNIIGALGVLAAVPELGAWRSLILAGGSFPLTLTDMQPASEQRYQRAEWAVWAAIRDRGLQRCPTFADYVIGNPDTGEEIDPRLMRISAQLRYTTVEDWLVFKERNIRDYGNEQFIDICRRLVDRVDFSGPNFSWGDKYIADRANGTDTRPGNPQTWRKVGTSHHLAMVLSQIASLGA